MILNIKLELALTPEISFVWRGIIRVIRELLPRYPAEPIDMGQLISSRGAFYGSSLTQPCLCNLDRGSTFLRVSYEPLKLRIMIDQPPCLGGRCVSRLLLRLFNIMTAFQDADIRDFTFRTLIPAGSTS
ncbi:hypothetical protein GXY_06905 [Novacetimonas hansenii ATCC 23769]|uniref:Uncharacterized protein n=1 Tax=Novacetimonas hansenii ATCC 23769 TaxID=714995 RepID=D5QE18_NOVHA|nr:hypothetical protein GXY_06905 [Novacetimonas hansenii ATCC 23769]